MRRTVSQSNQNGKRFFHARIFDNVCTYSLESWALFSQTVLHRHRAEEIEVGDIQDHTPRFKGLGHWAFFWNDENKCERFYFTCLCVSLVYISYSAYINLNFYKIITCLVWTVWIVSCSKTSSGTCKWSIKHFNWYRDTVIVKLLAVKLDPVGSRLVMYLLLCYGAQFNENIKRKLEVCFRN